MILARSYVTREVTERDSSLRSVDYYTDPDVVKRRGGQDHLVLLEGTTESIFATFKSPSPTAKIMSVGVASIGDFAAVGYDNGQVFTVTVEENKGDEQPFKMTGQMLTTHSGAVTFISFSNCNSVFATCGSDGLTNVWRRSLTSNEITQVSVFNDVPGLVNRAVFFPNSTDKIMICSENGRVNVSNT